jgi:hypothetical protein
MTKTVTEALYASLGEASVEANTSDLETLSLRVPASTQSMVQAFSLGFKRPALTLLTDALSQSLAEHLLSSKDNIPLVRDEVGKGYEAGSALSILRNRDAILVGQDAIWARAMSQVKADIQAKAKE